MPRADVTRAPRPKGATGYGDTIVPLHPWHPSFLQDPEIEDKHLAELLRLPHPDLSHGDPFDRLLAAQARVEGLELLSADAKLDAYGVRRVW